MIQNLLVLLHRVFHKEIRQMPLCLILSTMTFSYCYSFTIRFVYIGVENILYLLYVQKIVLKNTTKLSGTCVCVLQVIISVE